MTTPIRKAVFPAAGLGTRFLPATKAIPKEMLPLVDKPTIQYGIEEAVASGVTDIILVTAEGKEAMEQHFSPAPGLEGWLEERGKGDLLEQVRALSSLARVSSVLQGDPLGLGHAVLVARNEVGNEPFAVILADDVMDSDPPALAQMIAVFEEVEGPVILVERVPREHASRYGIIAYEAVREGVYRITDLVEKPPVDQAPSDLAIVGRYILTPDLFDILEATGRDSGGEIQLTNALKRQLGARPLYACEVTGVRHDTGNTLGFLKAAVHFGLKRADIGDALRAYLKTLDLG